MNGFTCSFVLGSATAHRSCKRRDDAKLRKSRDVLRIDELRVRQGMKGSVLEGFALRAASNASRAALTARSPMACTCTVRPRRSASVDQGVHFRRSEQQRRGAAGIDVWLGERCRLRGNFHDSVGENLQARDASGSGYPGTAIAGPRPRRSAGIPGRAGPRGRPARAPSTRPAGRAPCTPEGSRGLWCSPVRLRRPTPLAAASSQPVMPSEFM